VSPVTQSASLTPGAEWTTEDLQVIAGLLVNAMIATVEAILDVPVAAPARAWPRSSCDW
jgi:hypothetical protein